MREGDIWMPHLQYQQLAPSIMDQPCAGALRAVGVHRARQPQELQCDSCGYELALPLQWQEGEDAINWMVEASRLPAHHAATKLEENDSNRDALAALRAWARAWHKRQIAPAPMLVGPVGTGKTQLLVTASIGIVKMQRKPVMYWPTAELLTAERQTFKSGEASVIERCKTSPVLVLDDLGAERGTDFALDALGELIDSRYRNGLPTLGASNVDPTEWPEVFGDRTASRLMEATAPIYVGGEDRRLVG